MGLWGFPSALGTSCHFPITPPLCFCQERGNCESGYHLLKKLPDARLCWPCPVTITVMEILPQAPSYQGTFVEQGQTGLFNL